MYPENLSIPLKMTFSGEQTPNATSDPPTTTRTSDLGPAAEQCAQHAYFVSNTIVAGAICLLGFAGNSVSFFVLARDKSTPVASFLLRALAFTDNFFLCAWFLHFTLESAFQYMDLVPQFHISWLYVRVYTYPLLFIGQTGTIWLTVLIAVSRYVAVCKPYHAAKYCTVPVIAKGVLFTAIFSVLYNVPRFFEAKFVLKEEESKDGSNGTESGEQLGYTLHHTELGKSDVYQILYFDILYYIFSFVLPLILLVYLNTRLTLVYRVIRFRRRTMSSRQDNHDNNITLVMIVVILVFIFCNAPGRIVQVLWGYQTQRCPSAKFVVIAISNILEVFNSSANFLIYCVFRQKFRHILHHTLCRAGNVPCPRDEETSRFPLNGAPVSFLNKTRMTECTV